MKEMLSKNEQKKENSKNNVKESLLLFWTCASFPWHRNMELSSSQGMTAHAGSLWWQSVPRMMQGADIQMQWRQDVNMTFQYCVTWLLTAQAVSRFTGSSSSTGVLPTCSLTTSCLSCLYFSHLLWELECGAWLGAKELLWTSGSI